MMEVTANGHLTEETPEVQPTEGTEVKPVEVVDTDIVLPEDPDELRKLYIEMGGKPSWKSFQTGEQAAFNRAQTRINQAKQNNPFASASENIGKTIARISVGFIQIVFSLGLPIGLLFLLGAEGAAITEGVSIFSPTIPWLYSGALMVFLFVILFVYEVVHRNNVAEGEAVFSVRSLFERMQYTIGLGRRWQTKYKPAPTPLMLVETAMITVSRAIIFFGILGRLKVSLDETKSMNWHQGLVQIATQSSLETILGYVGNVLLAMTLLSSAHVIVYLIHRFYVLSTGGLDIASDGALGFLASIDENAIVQSELKQFYSDQIYLLKAHNDSKKN